MSKRRITKQQSARIKKNQATYHENRPEKTDSDQSHSHLNQSGLVMMRFGRHAEVETHDHQRIRCAIRQNIDDIVAGDEVIWQNTDPGQGVIVSCCPRRSILGRPAFRGQYKAVAANITQLLIVVAPKPEISWLLLDSYLVMAELLKLKACIILNKVDLPCESIQHELRDHYATLDYPLLMLSQKAKTGQRDLIALLQAETSVFVGQSGVGKSSLISTVLPHETLIIGDISEKSELGSHTTSNSRLYHLPEGGRLIDSPGVRAFGLWEASKQDIIYGFREFRSLPEQCKYSNCAHINTPHCAITAALNTKKLSLRRYQNLITLLGS